jgi:hypothetical protein
MKHDDGGTVICGAGQVFKVHDDGLGVIVLLFGTLCDICPLALSVPVMVGGTVPPGQVETGAPTKLNV